ncbi:MAG: UDP-N-acetylmuramate--L-alanine ligase [Bacteroidales bacterium]|nr:UDP-N-acetylmuramate--L-alanine ligase [Bacteroidales bacterium]
MNFFDNIDNVYFLGIGGIGMSALARYFNKLGKSVSGYDLTRSDLTDRLVSEGISISYADSVDSIPAGVRNNLDRTLVIYTPAVPVTNEIFVYLQQSKVEMHKRARVLGMIADNYSTIAVSGTHGKTTNSCVIANILSCAGKDNFAFLGGISRNIDSNLMMPEARERFESADTWLVAEADEFDRSFLWLHPKITIVTYVDADHLDIYKDRNDIIQTFNKFVDQNSEDGVVILNKVVDPLVRVEKCRKVTYSESDASADFHAANIRLSNGVYTIDAVTPEGVISDITIGAKGRVNIENTMACVAAAVSAGISHDSIRQGIASFKGVKRRLEFHVQKAGCTYIDDYAHHPRELMATIKSVRELFPGKRITGIFQPHLFTRTRDFAEGFAESLDLLDDLILMDIYPAREKPIPGVDSKMIAGLMHNKNVTLMSDHKQIVDKVLADKAEVVLTLGAGSVDKLIAPLTKALNEKD